MTPATRASRDAQVAPHRFHLPARARHFHAVLPETDALNAKRIAVRLQEELQDVRTKYGKTFDLVPHRYPQGVSSAHELEDILKSQLSRQDEWDAPVPAVAK